jgi:hypothetical protein
VCESEERENIVMYFTSYLYFLDYSHICKFKSPSCVSKIGFASETWVFKLLDGELN